MTRTEAPAAEPAAELERPALPRAVTIEDPLTTGLLAEVARRSQTMEVDDATLEAARREADATHPNTRRRRRTTRTR